MPQMQGRVTAALGPTNTGKTHYAVERMLAYRTGIIGLPLRLLAREIYNKIVDLRGPSVVALLTGEERIIPSRTQYWVCTTEAMPGDMAVDFLAVDEIQLAADPERGHVFTDRLLRARGLMETVFMGSDTMRDSISALVPKVSFQRRERLSTLSYTGAKKISRLPHRSAIVGFSVESVYAIAELVRRQKGGAAVVMGALSPRTRNAQVSMYESGEVDYLVATDAIGMGLNLDIGHVAFSGLSKFDGRKVRDLAPNELAQIAGRAGRFQTDGSFGVTGDAPPLAEGVVKAITTHSFTPVQRLQWRNHRLDFSSVDRLIESLETPADGDRLVRARDADDLIALRVLAGQSEIRARAKDEPSVRLLWDVCSIPDFRGISHEEHAELLGAIHGHLHESGEIPEDWLSGQIQHIDRTDGNIDMLSRRLAFIRTWTYVAQRSGWCPNESHWRDFTRAVEDRLSDALHAALTRRFVDRRTSILMRGLKQKENLVAEVNDKGEVTIEGQFVGHIDGFRFRQDVAVSGDEAKTVRAAAIAALGPEFRLRADRFYNSPDTEMDFTDQGGLMWGEHPVGKLVAGDDPLKPQVASFVDDEADADVAQKVERRLQHFIDRKIALHFLPLLNIRNDESLSGIAKGFGFRMVEAMGIIDRREVASEVKELDQEARGVLRKHGIRFGQFTIFMPDLLKPAPTRLRLVLWSLARGDEEFPQSPPPGLVTIPAVEKVPAAVYLKSGYRRAGERAIRIDMLERLADMLRTEDSRGGFEATPDMLSITGTTLVQFANLMEGLGYKATRGEREKVRQATDQSSSSEGKATLDTPETAPDAPETAPEAPETAQEAPVREEPGDQVSATQQAPDSVDDGPEIEEFYTFVWSGRRSSQRKGARPQRKGKKAPRKEKSKNGPNARSGRFEARPPKEDRIDPDNPFAQALQGLKNKKGLTKNG